MEIYEYFKRLIRGEFPQNIFLKWLEINDKKWWDAFPDCPFKPDDVLGNFVSLAVLKTVSVCFLLFAGFGYFLTHPISDQSIIGKMIEGFREDSSPLIFLFGAIVIGCAPLIVSAQLASHFKKNLNQFQLDFAELQILLGTFNFVSELSALADRVMVRLAQDILTVEAGSRSKSTDEVLTEIRTRMRKVEQITTKFGFTTKPWEEYFQEASGQPKQSTAEIQESLRQYVKGIQDKIRS
jgi:hypothetical protein